MSRFLPLLLSTVSANFATADGLGDACEMAGAACGACGASAMTMLPFATLGMVA